MVDPWTETPTKVTQARDAATSVIEQLVGFWCVFASYNKCGNNFYISIDTCTTLKL